MQRDATEYAWKCEQCQKHALDDTSTGREFKSHFQPLALCAMGARYCQSILSGYRKLKVCSSSRRLFHQVGGGRGVGEHPGCGC